MTWNAEWPLIKKELDSQAAVPVGFIYGHSANPTDQHQVLAIGYKETGPGTATLTVWDNNEPRQNHELALDFRGGELAVGNASVGKPLKCIFLERYSPQRPPSSLNFN